MFYRRAGIRHLDYRQERQLWPLPFDRLLVGVVVAAGAGGAIHRRPPLSDRLSVAVADLVVRGARAQFVDGRCRPDSSRLRRRNGDRRLHQRPPSALWHAAGAGDADRRPRQCGDRRRLRFCGVARQKPLPRDGDDCDAIYRRLCHHPHPRRQRRRHGFDRSAAGAFPRRPDRRRPADLLYGAARVRDHHIVPTQREPHRAWPGARRHPREGLRGRDHRHRHVQVQAPGLLDQFLHRRRRRLGAGRVLSAQRVAGAIPSRPVRSTRSLW